MDKKRKLLDIIQSIQDLYPHLDRLMIDDVDNPGSIMISSEDHMRQIAESYGIEMEEVDEFFEGDLEEEQLDLLEWGGEDDGDKGPLQ